MFDRREAVIRSCSSKIGVFFKFHLKACNFIKKRLQHKCFPVNIANFLKTAFLNRISPVSASDKVDNTPQLLSN